MSHIIKNLASGPVPPSVPQQFTADDGTIGVPVANNFNLLSNAISANNVNGIQTTTITNGSANHYTQLTNRISGSVTTTNATPTTIASFSLGATPAVFTFDIQIVSFNMTDVNGDGYFISGTARTDGTTATLCGTPDKIINEEVADTADANMVVSGNNVIFQADGIMGKTHHWSVLATYIKVI